MARVAVWDHFPIRHKCYPYVLCRDGIVCPFHTKKQKKYKNKPKEPHLWPPESWKSFCQETEMGLSAKYLPQFGNRERLEQTLKIITLQNTPLQQPLHLPTCRKYTTRNHTHTHTHTSALNRAIYVSMYFRESAQGQILHLYSGWQQRCAGVAFLSTEMPYTQKQSYVTHIKEAPLKARTHSWHSNKPKEFFFFFPLFFFPNQLLSCVGCY